MRFFELDVDCPTNGDRIQVARPYFKMFFTLLPAASVARRFVEIQGNAFRSWGVLGDWSNAYLTMDRRYEARQIRAFGELFEKVSSSWGKWGGWRCLNPYLSLQGLIERDLWPVHWSYATK